MLFVHIPSQSLNIHAVVIDICPLRRVVGFILWDVVVMLFQPCLCPSPIFKGANQGCNIPLIVARDVCLHLPLLPKASEMFAAEVRDLPPVADPHYQARIEKEGFDAVL